MFLLLVRPAHVWRGRTASTRRRAGQAGRAALLRRFPFLLVLLGASKTKGGWQIAQRSWEKQSKPNQTTAGQLQYATPGFLAAKGLPPTAAAATAHSLAPARARSQPPLPVQSR